MVGVEKIIYPTNLTPMLPVEDVDKTIAWYEDLGCKVQAINQAPRVPHGLGATHVWRCGLHAVRWRLRCVRRSRDLRSTSILKTSKRSINKLRERAEISQGLETAFHGMREFILSDPNGYRLVFGQRVAEQPDSIQAPPGN